MSATNATIETILNRRSVRVYSDKQISQDDLDLILKSGSYAPSGCGAQPWHFTVIQNKEIINTLSKEAKKVLKQSGNEMFKNVSRNEEFNLFYNAPTVIVVSGEKSAPVPQVDCSAATQNMLLAAESIGVGSCWVGFVTFLFISERAQEFRDLLQIPDGYEPYYAITLGYKKLPNQKPQPRRGNIVNYIK